MSISSYTVVTMLDSRPSPITIPLPRTTDILNRIITFKDLYGSASTNTITLVTRNGDTFEDGTFSTIMSNTYQTLNFYAGQPGKWLNIDGGSGGGSSAGLTTVSNNLTTVSNSVVTNMGYLTSVSNAGVSNTTNLTTVSNSVVTNMGYLTSVSNSVVINMGYQTSVSNAGVSNTTNLTTVSNTVAAGRFTGISTNTISTSLIIAGYVSSPQGYISSLIVDALSFSLSNSFISMGDIITTSVSTIQTFTSTLTTNNLKVGTVSSLSYIAFSGLQQGYNQTVIAEQSTGTGIQELLFFKGSTTTDRIRIQTTGPIVFEPGVSARVFPATGSNATPAMIITTGSNVGIGVAAPTVSLDVAGAGRFTAVSTNAISTNTINSSNISNVGNLSNGGSAYFFSNGTTAASPSTTNAYPYASFIINSASTNTLTPVVPLLLMTGNYGGSVAGGLTQNVGPVLTLGTIDNGGATKEGYRLTGSNSAFYGNMDMRSNNISNVANQYFQYGGNITGSIGGTGGQQGFLNITYPAAGAGHTNDGVLYLWGGNANGNRYINLDSTNIGITVPKGYGNIWLDANTINTGTFDMYSNIICNVSNLNFITGGSISNVNATRTVSLSTNTISTNTISTNTIYAGTIYGNGTNITGITSGFVSTATSDLNMNGYYLKDLTGNVDISGASINLHTSSIQQYLNYVPVPQPVIQFGSWSGPAAGSDGTWGVYETITITDYNNTNYCIYITGKNNSSISPSYTAVPLSGYSFSVYIGGGDQTYSNIFYWQTMGNYGASAGPATQNTGGGGGPH